MFRIARKNFRRRAKDKERETMSELQILAPVPDHSAELRIHTFTTK